MHWLVNPGHYKSTAVHAGIIIGNVFITYEVQIHCVKSDSVLLHFLKYFIFVETQKSNPILRLHLMLQQKSTKQTNVSEQIALNLFFHCNLVVQCTLRTQNITKYIDKTLDNTKEFLCYANALLNSLKTFINSAHFLTLNLYTSITIHDILLKWR